MSFPIRKNSNDLSISQFVDITLEEKMTAMVNHQVATLAKKIEDKFEENEKSLKEKLVQVGIDLLRVENDNDALIKDNKSLKSHMQDLVEKVNKITTEKTELVKKVEEQSVKISELNLAVEGLQQDNGLLRETLKITQKENEELKANNKVLEDERNQNHQTAFRLSGEIDKLKSNITSLEKENDRLSEKKIKLKKNKAQLLSEKEQLEKTNKELEVQKNKEIEKLESELKTSKEEKNDLEAQKMMIIKDFENRLKESAERTHELESQYKETLLDLESTRDNLESEMRVNAQLNISNKLLSHTADLFGSSNRFLERERTHLVHKNAELQANIASLNETILNKDQTIQKNITEQQNLQVLIARLTLANEELARNLNEAHETIRLKDEAIHQKDHRIEDLNERVIERERFIERIKQPLKDKGLEVDDWNADQIAIEIGRLLDQKNTLDEIKDKLEKENIKFDDIPQELIRKIETLITSSKNFTEIKNKFISIGLDANCSVNQIKEKVGTLKKDGDSNAEKYRLYKEFYDGLISALHNNRYLPTRNERKAKVVKNPKHVTERNKTLIKEASQKDSKYDLEIKHVEAILNEVITRSGLSRFFMNIGK